MAARNHVENPFEYFIEKLSWTMSDFGRSLFGRSRAHLAAAPEVRRIEAADLWASLRQGMADLGAARADVLFIGAIYPITGILLVLAFSRDLLPLVFPLVSGFALIGPLAAVGLYEISRRREQGEEVSWTVASRVFSSPSLPAILGMGAILLALFLLWIAAAFQIYLFTIGSAHRSVSVFVHDVLQTPAGWAMIVVGCAVGFVFAVVAFVLSVISFPLLLDRDVGLRAAIATSLRAVAANPGTMALWGLIVAVALAIGSIPALIGLVFVMPVLGHATWHLYRKVTRDV